MKDDCLIIKPNPEQTILSYQVEMLHYNPQPGIIPLQKRILNQELCLHYSVGSRQSLGEYFRSGGPTENTLPFLKKIVAVLQDSEDLLLYPASFLLEADSIYLDSGSGEITLIYRPFPSGCSVRDSLLRLSEELLKLTPPSAEARAGIQDFNRYLKEQFTSLAGLKKYLDELSRHGVSTIRASSPKPFRLARGEKTEAAAKRKNVGTGLVEKKKEQAWVIALRGKSKEVFFFALIQLFIALLLLRSAGYLNSLEDPLATYAGVALVLGGFNLFLLRRLFANERKGQARINCRKL